MIDKDFETWWKDEGSQTPFFNHDTEEHCKRMCEIAWNNGAYKERDAIAAMIEDMPALVDFYKNEKDGCLICGFTPKLAAASIRARGNHGVS